MRADGNDYVYNDYGRYAKINVGAGNDEISLESHASNAVIQFAAGGDNDTVIGFDSNDTLQITTVYQSYVLAYIFQFFATARQ